MKSSFVKVLSLLLIFSTQADELDYRWLELTSHVQGQPAYINPEQREWIKEQTNLRDAYLKDKKVPFLADFMNGLFQEETTLQKLKLKDGRAVLWTISAGAKYHQVILENTDGTKKTIVSTQNMASQLSDLHLYSNYSFNGIELSPNEKYLIVGTPRSFTTTTSDFIIFDLSDLDRKPHTVKDLFGSGFSWDSDDSFYYSVWSGGNTFTFKIDLLTGNQQYFPDFFDYPMAYFADSKFQYNIVSAVDIFDGREQTDVKFKIKVPGSDKESEIVLERVDKKEISNASPVKALKKSFLLKDGYRNIPKIFFVQYDYQEGADEVLLKSVKKYESPKNGSFQNILTSEDFVFVEFLSGPVKLYKVYSGEGREIISLDAPKAATMVGFKSLGGDEFEFTFTSNVVKRKKLKYTIGQKELWNPHAIDKQMLSDESGVEYKQSFLFAVSADGESIPMRVVHRKDLAVDETTPLYIDGYGGHGIVTTFRPSFNIGIKELIKRNAVYVALGVRGGGEYGNPWYEAVHGTLKRFEDTEALISDLHQRKIGSPQTTAFEGWSNGGLLAGVILTRRPDLFKLVIPGNGLHDMVRKEILEGPYSWNQEFGDSMSRENVEFLKSYSPLVHAMKFREYPTVYVIAGGQDKRVNPSHSIKLVAALQDYQKGGAPIILDFIENAGHWPTTPSYSLETGLKGFERKWKVIFSELGIK